MFLQVVLASAADGDPFFAGLAPQLGHRDRCLPARYWPVIDFLFLSSLATVPECTMSPPCSPAPGPMSTTWSATRMVSSSCSTTMTVLPEVPEPLERLDQPRLSRWCSPIDGSSRTYRTPTRPEPIWDASRIRCASPPDNVPADRPSER